MWCHQILQHLEALLRLLCLTKAAWLGQLHNSHLLHCLGLALLQNATLTKALLQVHETKTTVLQTATAFVCDLTPITASCPVFCLSDSFWTVALSCVSSFHYSVSSLVFWTVLRPGIIMMLLSPSFSCRRALKDWKKAKFLPGKSCWFVPVTLWLYEWVNPKLKICIFGHVYQSKALKVLIYTESAKLESKTRKMSFYYHS